MIPSLPAELEAALRAVIAEMRGGVDILHEILLDERAALDSGDAIALDKASHAKQARLELIENLDSERRQLADAAGGDDASRDGWKEFVTALALCQQLNEINGRIVGQRMVQVRQALSLLTGGASDGELYGPGGRARASLRSSTLAQA